MTSSLRIPLGVLLVLSVFYLINQRQQKSHSISGEKIFHGKNEDVVRFVIKENDKELEIVRMDTTWNITGSDSLVIKENQIDNFFNRVLSVKKDVLQSDNPEKWEKFGIGDSIGRILQVFDKNDNMLIHYIFGRSSTDYQHNYVREANSNEVYRTNDNVYFLLNSRPTYWGNKPTPPTPDEVETNDDTPSE